jgi:hypothetical protein
MSPCDSLEGIDPQAIIRRLVRFILPSLFEQHLIDRINHCQSTGPHHILFINLIKQKKQPFNEPLLLIVK